MHKLIKIIFFTLSISSFIWGVFPNKLANAQSATGCSITIVGEPGSDVEKPTCTGNGSGTTAGDVDGACVPSGEYPSNPSQVLSDNYGITLQGYDDEHVKNVYDLFACLEGTRFGSLVYGTTLINGKTIIDGVETIGMNCPEGESCTIWITQMPGRPTTFKFILTHELGHVISNQNTREIANWTAVENAFAKEEGISLYARAGIKCNGASSVFEDYADMIAYFLHPNAGETTPNCDPDKNPPNPFFALNQFPDHLDAAKRILLP